MSTATETGKVETGLWGGAKLEIIGVSGEFGCGKTLFGLTIDPTQTIVYDFEKSSATYEGLGIKRRVDVPAEIHKVHPKGYSQIQLWLWWRDHVRNLPAGEYKVCFVDPFSDIEAGLADWVAANPGEFGHTEKQYEKGGGIYWGDTKNFQNNFMLDLGARVETFCFSTHMRDVFKGGAPTGMREPKGKETLMKLATLYLLLERKPDEKGRIPQEPTAIVLKSRLAHTAWIDGKPKIQPILPPRLSVATPEAIRAYIAKPPDYAKLKESERIQIKPATEEDLLEKKRQIASLELAKEELTGNRLQLMADAARLQAKEIEKKSEGLVTVVGGPSPTIATGTTPPTSPTITVPTTMNGQTNDILSAYVESAQMLEQQLGMSEAGRVASYAKRGFADLQSAPDHILADYVTALRKKLEKTTSTSPKA